VTEARVIAPARTTEELAALHRIGGLRAVHTQGAIDNDAALTDVYARRERELQSELDVLRAQQAGRP
jgi:hypothetical protein